MNSKEVKINDKKLWHIQANIDWHDDTYDIFILSVREPAPKQYAKIYAEECGLELDDVEVKDFIKYANVYSVYADEL